MSRRLAPAPAWRRFGAGAACALAVALLAGAPARLAAQEPMQPAEPMADSALKDPEAAALDSKAADIAAQLRCPVCSGQSVLESNSDIAQEMQEVIRERLGEGQSEREILAYFRGSYGDWIILKPRATGIGLLVYVLPAIALLGGITWVVLAVRRWSAASGASRRASAPEDPDAPPDPGGPGPESDLSAEDEAWLRRSIGG
ncbi:MAG: cytochrome c-type biogenesis protein CcmH [Gemmatimonadales bacterium]|jgi:cytochrome c-type biogenesis protein CcmH